MNKSQQIRDGLAAFASKYGPLQAIVAKVNSVDAAGLTCECDYDGITLYDVRLRCVINGKESITFFPKVGGYVLAARIENSEEDWMVIACDETDKCRIVIGTLQFEMDATGYLIKKDADSLKEIIQMIIEAVQQIVVMQGNNPDYAKLIQAMTKLNNVLR